MPKTAIGKAVFIIAIVVTVVEIISNLDTTFYLHATQYVPEGEHADPIRIADVIDDIVQPFYYGTVLYVLSLIVDKIKKAPQ